MIQQVSTAASDPTLGHAVLPRTTNRSTDGNQTNGVNGGINLPTEFRVMMCVQLRLACSAGDKPAGARVRSPVAWIAGRRETESLKPIDEHLRWGMRK